ncbi:MAG: sensor histidine kinase [Myxococcota bacterium]
MVLSNESEDLKIDVSSLLARDSERALRFMAPAFAFVNFIEAWAHRSDDMLLWAMPAIMGSLLSILAVWTRVPGRTLRWPELWILAPWVSSIVVILPHINEKATLASTFVTMGLVLGAAVILPIASFATMLVGMLALQTASVLALPGAQSGHVWVVPAITAILATSLNASRRRSIIATEENHQLAQALQAERAERLRLQAEQRGDRLEEAVLDREAALEESRRTLREKERLAAIGTLAAGVAHQVNNPVGAILAITDFAQASREEDDSAEIARTALDDIRAEALRCGRIVRGLMRFAGQTQLKRESIDLIACLDRAIESTTAYARSSCVRIELDVAPSARGRRVLGSAVELEEVFVNLIRNGIESASTSVEIEAVVEENKNRVAIHFTDDGPGVAPEVAHRLFEPFYTTRIEDGGTGLGLAIAHGVVEEHQGQLVYSPRKNESDPAESELTSGAVFSVSLPLEAGL